MKYKLVSEANGHELETTVNDLILKGWIPLGGVSVAVVRNTWKNERKDYEENETEWIYAQSMRRRGWQFTIFGDFKKRILSLFASKRGAD